MNKKQGSLLETFAGDTASVNQRFTTGRVKYGGLSVNQLKKLKEVEHELSEFKDVYKLTLLIYSLTKDFSKEREAQLR